MPRLEFFKVTPPGDSASVIAVSRCRILWEILDSGKPVNFVVTDYHGNECWRWDSWDKVKQNLSLRILPTRTYKKLNSRGSIHRARESIE